jgi:hypothetical protein
MLLHFGNPPICYGSQQYNQLSRYKYNTKSQKNKKAAGLAMFAMSGMDLVLNLNYLAHEYMWTEFLNEDRTSLLFS